METKQAISVSGCESDAIRTIRVYAVSEGLTLGEALSEIVRVIRSSCKGWTCRRCHPSRDLTASVGLGERARFGTPCGVRLPRKGRSPKEANTSEAALEPKVTIDRIESAQLPHRLLSSASSSK